MKILVLETDEKDQIITESLLKDAKHRLIILPNPYDIIKILKNESFDIIFVPLEIKGIDAIKLCRRIRYFNQAGILYAYSQQLQIYNTDTLEDAGFDGFLKWPAKNETLKTAIEGAAWRLMRLASSTAQNCASLTVS